MITLRPARRVMYAGARALAHRTPQHRLRSPSSGPAAFPESPSPPPAPGLESPSCRGPAPRFSPTGPIRRAPDLGTEPARVARRIRPYYK